MFGWFRKRQRPVDALEADAPQAALTAPVAPDTAAPAQAAPAAAVAPAPMPAVPNPAVAAPASAHTPDASVVAAPSARPAMPLSARPNFAGLGLAETGLEPPRLLDPTAALSESAREELTALLTDMFGAAGRYRLEWRPDREEGDDAMFSQIMVADLVRRIQNTLGAVAALEAGDSHGRSILDEAERRRAIERFLKREETLHDLVEKTTPSPETLREESSEVDGDRKIA